MNSSAPVILHVFAPGYAEQSTTLLRLLGASVPMVAVWTVFLAFVWLEQRMALLAVYNWAVALVMAGATILLAPTLGIDAAGWAVLGTFCAAAAWGGAGLVRRLGAIRRGEGSRWVQDTSS